MNPSKFFNTPPAKATLPTDPNRPHSIQWRANATGQPIVTQPHTLGAPTPATSAHAAAVHRASMLGQAARVPRLKNLATVQASVTSALGRKGRR